LRVPIRAGGLLDRNMVPALDKGYKQENVLFCHTDDYKTFFAIVVAVIKAFNSERVPNTFVANSKLTP
jgi:hypothetical protein